MIRAIIGFAAGCVVGGWAVKSGSVKKFREIATEKAAQLKTVTQENAGKLKSAAQKAATAVKEEFSSKKEDAKEGA